MEIRNTVHPEHAEGFNTDRLRNEFLIEKLFVAGELNLTYSHYDRIIVGGIVPLEKPLTLGAAKELAADFFFQRREGGVINIGAPGKVVVDGETYVLGSQDALYIGMGAEQVEFVSDDAATPAHFYFLSGTAHKHYPNTPVSKAQARKVHLGSTAESNERTIYQYLHPDVLESCQLCMGVTHLEPGCVWNTMPCHTHDRRMEVYLYFDMDPETVVFHLMGEPQETRHIVMRNEQAVISPSWSIHSGVGTSNYTFIWGMVGENQTFTDMDAVAMTDLR